MKKKLKYGLTALLTALLLWTTALPALAGDPALLSPATAAGGLYHVTDAAGLLTQGEIEDLAAQCAALTAKYHCTVYIVTMTDYRDYTVGYSMEDCSDDIREFYRLDWNQIMMLLSVNGFDREVHLMAYGDFANESFTDFGKEKMLDAMMKNLKAENWYAGCQDYLDQVDRLLDLSVQGTPLDVTDKDIMKDNLRHMWFNVKWYLRHPIWGALGMCMGAGAAVSGLITLSLGSAYKSVKKKEEADTYMDRGSVNITFRSDEYTTTTTKTRHISKSSSSGGTRSGGKSRGGTTVNSRGSSHAGRKF